MISDTSIQSWMHDLAEDVKHQYNTHGSIGNAAYFLDAHGHTLTIPISVMLQGFEGPSLVGAVMLIHRMLENIARCAPYRSYAYVHQSWILETKDPTAHFSTKEFMTSNKTREYEVVAFETRAECEVRLYEVTLYHDDTRRINKYKTVTAYAFRSPFLGILYPTDSIPPEHGDTTFSLPEDSGE